VKAIRRLHVRTVLPSSLAPLHDLALNLRWSWHPPTRDLFAGLDPELWESTGQDPVAILSSLRSEDMERLAADEDFVARVREVHEDLQRYLSTPRWYHEHGAGERDGRTLEAIAYFCVSELLTNVAKHSGAGRATLALHGSADSLRLQVTDDGTGGARLVAGRGLAGLTERVRTVDGRLTLSSPEGGPTVATVDLPLGV